MTVKSFPPDEFLNLAERMVYLKNILDDEALIRTVMNRCYYAVFLVLREKLGLPENTTHRKVYEEVKRKNIKLAGYLDILWVYRRGADYYLHSPVVLRGWAITHRVSFELDKAERCIDIAQRALSEAI